MRTSTGFYNYKRLNDNTHIDGYTIPSKEVLINRIEKAKWFSKFDLKSEFHQVKILNDLKHMFN